MTAEPQYTPMDTRKLMQLTKERDEFHAALLAIDRTLERITGIFPQSVVQPDGTTHVRTEREEGENAATMRLTGAIWGILNPFWLDGTLPDIDDEITRLTRELGAAREDAMSWVREVTGRDCDIARLTAELAEARAAEVRLKALGASVSDEGTVGGLGAALLKAERERDEARQQRDDAWHGLDPDRDAAIALLRQVAQSVQVVMRPDDPVILQIPRRVWADIDALLSKKERP